MKLLCVMVYLGCLFLLACTLACNVVNNSVNRTKLCESEIGLKLIYCS